MIKVSVLFPSQSGARFDAPYYFSKHLPMIVRHLGAALKGFSIEQGISGAAPGSRAPFAMMAHFQFESQEAFQSAFWPHADAIMADVANYTTIEPSVQVSEIKYSR
jgi:uncharacterized protein (TIGR02118 family)